MQEWQVARIRDKIEEFEGELAIRIYTADEKQLRIWYNPKDRVALYAGVVWDDALKRDKNVKAWAGQIAKAINVKGTRIEVYHKNGKKSKAWFGPERDMKPVSAVYEYVMHFEKDPKSLKDSVNGKEGNGHGADKKQASGNGHKPEPITRKTS